MIITENTLAENETLSNLKIKKDNITFVIKNNMI
jgi:hypothetical protein